jgi:uncharacterized protein YdiU (UPF0061 family)
VPAAAPSLFVFDNTYVRDLPELGERWKAAEAPAPLLLALTAALAAELGVDARALREPDGVGARQQRHAGTHAATAQAYSGHQSRVPPPGDGRRCCSARCTTGTDAVAICT